ncbi:hypothetical protein [Spirillospora sp. NPDC047279]|uniref:hypothetical protein n=1 Tax=Spirillospora sp. NPDC047279 TaxID=3155478 RepID=UPI0033E6C909
MAIPQGAPRGATITGKLDDVLARLDAQQEILIRQQASLDNHQVGLDNQQRLIAALHQDQSDMIRRMSGVEGA